jgi:thymidylate synthase
MWLRQAKLKLQSMNNLDKQYTDLLQDIIDNGVTKQDRTGTGTLSVFGRQIRHKMSDGFPLLTTKKMTFKLISTELMWFLRGDTNIKFLVDNDCHIWDGDAYLNWRNKGRDFWEEQVDGMFTNELGEEEVDKISKEWFINKIKTDDEFAKKWGDLGPIYGKQWRAFGGYNKVPSGWDHGSITSFKDVSKCDQLKNLINDLKTNPDSRRLMVTAWNPCEIDQMVLPPCHYGFQVYTRELSEKERYQIFDERGYEFMMNNWSKEEQYNKAGIPTRAISLMFNMRSIDTFLGLPFNIASYGLLLEIIAKLVNMVPDELIGNLGDTHLYLNHIEQAKEQIGTKLGREELNILYNERRGCDHLGDTKYDIGTIIAKDPTIPRRTREPYPLPTLKHLRSDDKYTLLNEFPSLWNEFKISDFEMENYQSHPTIKAPLSN